MFDCIWKENENEMYVAGCDTEGKKLMSWSAIKDLEYCPCCGGVIVIDWNEDEGFYDGHNM